MHDNNLYKVEPGHKFGQSLVKLQNECWRCLIHSYVKILRSFHGAEYYINGHHPKLNITVKRMTILITKLFDDSNIERKVYNANHTLCKTQHRDKISYW